ncbi:hypothetical protein HDU98_008537 [Podochytrium sp. JEL0797]|nr:hypothetical protein HDU98_008537 [Podochytrium sp. JEL0797]
MRTAADESVLTKAMAKKNVFVATIAAHQSALKPTTNETPTTNTGNISVHFRTRPLSALETNHGYFPVLFCDRAQTTLYYPAFRMLTDNSVDVQQFSFDGNHGPLESNEDVYRSAVLPKLQETIETNGMLTIMAYGQTGSGKTYTMSAIAHQIVNDLPLELPGVETQAVISIIEIQGDNLRDLAVAHPVAVSRKNLTTPPSVTCKVLLDADGQPKLMGVQELVATTKQEVMDCFQHGFDMRTTRSTLKNSQSSRTHFMCIINIEGGNGMNIEIKIVDLAGSETGSDKKEHDAVRLKESIAINKSLMSLKDCIRAASALPSNGEPKDNSSSSYIPFRSSKLTMLLKPTLDPSTARSTHMAIFALAAPTIADIPHTFNTYRYALALKSMNSASSGDGMDDSVLEHTAAVAPAAGPAKKTTATTPMAWSRIKLERWIESCFENQVTLTHLLGPQGDPMQYGKSTAEFVLPPWKFLYSMSGEEWVQNAKKHAKFDNAELVKGVRERYRRLFLQKREVVEDGMGKVGTGSSVLMLVEEGAENVKVGVVGEKKLTRAEIAMAKAKAKGAALRDGKKTEAKGNSFRM